MTLLHFANCIGVASAPYLLMYRFCGLSEYSAFWKCLRAGTAYSLTQLCKMILLASLFPVSNIKQDESIHTKLIRESVKCVVDALDFLGLYILLTKFIGKGEREVKVLATAVGWGTAELITTKLVPVWVGARGVEFRWIFFQDCLDSNINFILLLTTVALLWLWSRHDLNKAVLPFIIAMLGLILFRPLLFHYVRLYGGVDLWFVLAAKFVLASMLGLVTLQMYMAMTDSLS